MTTKKTPKHSRVPGALGMATVTATALTQPLAWLAYSKLLVNHDRELPPAVDAPRHTLATADCGTVSYYADTTQTGRPLVLIHGIHAAASAFEMSTLFTAYRSQRPVYAIDLPGFGFSDRTEREHSPELYANAILHLLRNALPEDSIADVVAGSLSSELAARACLEAPELFHTLAMISPTGFAKRDEIPHGPPPMLDRALHGETLGQAFFDLLTSRRSLRYYLEKSFVGEVDAALEEYAFLTSHRPGARYAPIAFLEGKIFTPKVRDTIYTHVSRPTLVLFDRDGYTSFEELLPFVETHGTWALERIPRTRGLPQFERLEETCDALDHFWANASTTEESHRAAAE